MQQPTIQDSTRINFKASPAVLLGHHDLNPKEMMCYLYMPIKMIDSEILEVEPRLWVFNSLILNSLLDFKQTYGADELHQRYVYITAKRLFVTPDNIGNRPGYHCDGFGTDDINYLWTDIYPTVFNGGDLSVRNNDLLALEDMDAQAITANEYEHPVKSLIRIDSWCPHRTPRISESGMRTFVKISISKHRYNLAGNSHNYQFNYDWTLHERIELRNMENKDFQQDPMFR